MKNIIKLCLISILLLFLNFVAYDQSANAEIFIAQEKIVNCGILISQPKQFNVEIRDIFLLNDINIVSDYSSWLKKNIVYQKDAGLDDWASPRDTLNRKYGDCEDFSFLNQAVLKLMGYSPQVLNLIALGRSHAICFFKENAVYCFFDNNRFVRTDCKTIREFAKYLFTIYRCNALAKIHTDSNKWDILYKRAEFK